MKNLFAILAVATLFIAGQAFAQDSLQVQSKKQYRYGQNGAAAQMQGQGVRGIGFVDENGDGYNDNAPDIDGDGIPNGMDEDYVGSQMRKGNGKGFVDADGDGINDNALDSDGDGIPNGQDPDYVRPQDGTGQKRGYGNANAGSALGTGTAECDGTGPKGKGRATR
jgi:hypothetical protein